MKRFIVILLGSACLISTKGQIKIAYYDYPEQADSVVTSFMGIINNHVASANKIIIPEMDIPKLLREDNGLNGIEKPFKFGKGIEQRITLDNGNWSEINGGRLWSLSFEADKATMLMKPNATIRVKNGGHLIIDDGQINDANLIVENGGILTINNNGLIKLRQDGKFYSEIGAVVLINYGKIE